MIDQLFNKNTLKYVEGLNRAENPSPHAKLRLHKNENPFGSPTLQWYHRFATRKQNQPLLEEIGRIKSIAPEKIFLSLGNHSIFDLLLRSFCEQGKDEVLICTPAPSAIQRYCLFNGITFHLVPLAENRQLDMIHFEQAVKPNTKLIWIASPNHITGNNMLWEDMETILNNFSGLLMIDESYINFSRHHSLLTILQEYPHLIIYQNFHHAWGMAALDVEMIYASPEITGFLNVLPSAKPLPGPVSKILLEAFAKLDQVNITTKEIVALRNELTVKLKAFSFIEMVYPSDANFFLVKCKNADALFHFLTTQGILVKPFLKEKFFENCLRISIGNAEENNQLLQAFTVWEQMQNKNP